MKLTQNDAKTIVDSNLALAIIFVTAMELIESMGVKTGRARTQHTKLCQKDTAKPTYIRFSLCKIVLNFQSNSDEDNSSYE